MMSLSVFLFFISPKTFANVTPNEGQKLETSSSLTASPNATQVSDNSVNFVKNEKSTTDVKATQGQKLEVQESSMALMAGNLTKVLFALGFVLFLMYFTYYLTRKFKIAKVLPSSIKILQVYQLGTKEKLLIVEAANRCLLLGVTPNQINTLAELNCEQIKESSQTPTEKVKFSDLLHKFSKGKKNN